MSAELDVVAALVLPTGRRVGEGFAADPWILRDVLEPIFARGPDRLPRNRLAYFELARGHWKTGGAAAVAIAETLVSPTTEVIVAAGDRDQAAIVAANVRGYAARGDQVLRSALELRADGFDVPSNGSRMRVISSDVATSWGLGGTHRRFRVIADELVVWRDSALWESLVSATGKVDDAQTIILSTAGFDPERSWQWRIRETAAREQWGYLFAPDGVVASWIRPEWVEQMRALLPPAAFERVIQNRWTAGVGDFVTPGQWARCVDPAWAPLATCEAGAHFGGLDLGLVKDRTALAIVHRDGDGNVRLDDLMVWQGRHGDEVPIESVERALVDAYEAFRPLTVLADPWQLKASIQKLQAAGVSIVEHPFTASSVARLSQTLYQSITGARLRVYPDRELEAEILGLRVVQTAGGWRVDHRRGGYSDRAIALALAAQAALERGDQEGVVATAAGYTIPGDGRPYWIRQHLARLGHDPDGGEWRAPSW